MSIPAGHTANFQTMLRAAADDNLCLMECVDAASGKPVYVVCMVNVHNDDSFEFVPVAKLFDGNPYDELVPPTTEETVQ